MQIGLVGCAMKKRQKPCAARNLYDRSPLFRGRRLWAVNECDEWAILSAAHGLIDPGATLAPYDESLSDKTRPEQLTWALRVLTRLGQELGELRGVIFSIHAGHPYFRDLEPRLVEAGAIVNVPTRGMGIGQQLAFYREYKGATL